MFGARPARLPLSIGDPTIVTGATAVVSMFELFAFYLQRGLIDVGFLGAAQIDRFGNLNSTVIGDYDAPIDAAAGLGRRVRDRDQRPEGVRDHAPVGALVRRARSTSGRRPATWAARRRRRRSGAPAAGTGAGRRVVVTDLGIWHFDETGEMRLDFLHPGATLDEVRATIAWEPKVSPDARHDARPRPPRSCASSARSWTPRASTRSRESMSHTHETAAAAHRGRLAIVLAITIGVFVLEAVGAAAANSLALLADAGHVLTDVAGLALALAAVWAAGRPANDARTFGYARIEVFAAVANAVLLMAIAVFVLFEAVAAAVRAVRRAARA